MFTRGSVVNGWYPWNGPDAVTPLSTTTHDSAKDIERCFNCKYAECNNCLCTDKNAKAIEAFEKLLDQKISRQEICDIMKISRATFFNYQAACAF